MVGDVDVLFAADVPQPATSVKAAASRAAAIGAQRTTPR
jgi:hypothetical protein